MLSSLSAFWKRLRRACPLALCLLGLPLQNGCQSLPPLPPVDLAEPGWRLFEGQAVWHRSIKAPGLAGELLLATNEDGRSLVQFAKPPVTLVTVQRDHAAWSARLPAQRREQVEPGEPPDELIWFQLPTAWSGDPPPEPWHFERSSDGHWRLDNLETGESLAGYLRSAAD